MAAYYNEHDPFAAAWLRNLIGAGLIAPGDVDERDIRDVIPTELLGYRQCHFFAGIGVWSYALRSAGWDDDRPIWTASCPCQPFSAAGRGGGVADDRHLWPHFFHLVRAARPVRCVGEQVASPDGLAWLDLVCADLEGEGYASGAVDICAAGVGAPHIRQRLYWMADAESVGGGTRGTASQHRAPGTDGACGSGILGGMADAVQPGRSEGRPWAGDRPASWGGGLGRLGDANGPGRIKGRASAPSAGYRGSAVPNGSAGGMGVPTVPGSQGEPDGGRDVCGPSRPTAERTSGQPAGSMDGRGCPSPTNGFWRNADWLRCRDARWRPVEPGTFPLAHGAAGRVGRLRAYGNALCAPVAIEFVRAMMEIDAMTQNGGINATP